MGILDKYRGVGSDGRDGGGGGFLRAKDVSEVLVSHPGAAFLTAHCKGSVHMVDLDGGPKPAITLKVDGIGVRTLILNQRNLRTIARETVSDTVEGLGVRLSLRRVDFRGESVASIDLSVPAQSHP